jgi:Ca2+-binding EF-hand superfamily protein
LIETWYECFHKDCPKGQLTSGEFKKIYAQSFPNGDSSAFAKHVFRRFDADRNQRISFREFLTALSITSKGNLEEKLNWAFGLYDTNGDGFITKEEMLEIVTVRFKKIKVKLI